MCPRCPSGSSSNSIDRLSAFGFTAHTGDKPDRLFGDRLEKLFNLRSAFLAPQIGERLTFQFTAHDRAKACSRETEGMTLLAVEGEDEGVAQDGADRARLDLVALRRHPAAAAIVPICEDFACGCVFHVRLSRRSQRDGLNLSRYGTVLPLRANFPGDGAGSVPFVR
jgi:hypothetical protein